MYYEASSAIPRDSLVLFKIETLSKKVPENVLNAKPQLKKLRATQNGVHQGEPRSPLIGSDIMHEPGDPLQLSTVNRVRFQ